MGTYSLSDKVTPLLKRGLPIKEVMRLSGCSKRTAYSYRNSLGLPREVIRDALDRDWSKVQTEYDLGLSLKNVSLKLLIPYTACNMAVKSGLVKLDPSRQKLKSEDLFKSGPKGKRGSAKNRILKEGLLPNECSVCHLKPEWNGKPLVMILDHINGDNTDHRLENFRFVCPNCDSQLPTYKRKNKFRRSEGNYNT